MDDKLVTVADYIERLKQFPADWRVLVSTRAGGGISVEHRDIKGEPVVAVFGSNGGRFGENPLTEEEYKKGSQEFLRDMANPRRYYTSDYGDHRFYTPSLGSQAGCYGTHYDRRIIERMVAEGLVREDQVHLDRVKNMDR